MADNVTLDTMTGGSVVATDEISGKHHQLVKVEFGDSDSATPVSTSAPLPVDTELPPSTALADGVSGATSVPLAGAANMVLDRNSGNLNRQSSVHNGQNTSGIGISAAGVVGQFDDVSPTTITENNFGSLRMSANRNLYGTIRDSAGNERGANVTTDNALKVDASATIQPVSGTVSIAGSLTPNTDFDYIDIQQTSATVETYVYKQGGASGSTVQTIVVTYTDSSKANLDKVEYS